mmetsp:Transcript_82745/g.210508  ORF Transcript_82745/g.210508 Transcript_82745/m.210508 type:complete len:544 (+) Transcript_82745:80-1711(+)
MPTPEGQEDWRHGKFGAVGQMSKSPPPSTAHFGSEDWRFGVVGRPKTTAPEAPATFPLSSGEGATAAPRAEAPQAIASVSAPASAVDCAAAAFVAKEANGRARSPEERKQALAEHFRRMHNVPSSPSRGMSGEVSERTLWGYWAQGLADMPELIKLCIETWRRHCPGWQVRILDASTVREYLSEAELPNRFSELRQPQLASDCVCLALLARYGGVWLDASVILRTDIQSLCWDAISSGERAAAAFFHSRYGTEGLGGMNFVETWCLATRAGNPFFLRWRDLLQELLHNRTDTVGLLQHPLYQGLHLEGLNKLNGEFPDFQGDFREQLPAHAMFQRLLEFDDDAWEQWSGQWTLMDAEATRPSTTAAESQGAGLIKLTTQHYSGLLQLPRERLLDRGTFVGQLLQGDSSGAVSGGGELASSRGRGIAAAAAIGAFQRRSACSLAPRWAKAGGTLAAALCGGGARRLGHGPVAGAPSPRAPALQRAGLRAEAAWGFPALGAPKALHGWRPLIAGCARFAATRGSGARLQGLRRLAVSGGRLAVRL